MEHAEIRRVCENFSSGECMGLQDAFPKITAAVKFRDRAEDPCVEQFTLAKQHPGPGFGRIGKGEFDLVHRNVRPTPRHANYISLLR